MNISHGFKKRSFELLDLSDNEVGYYGVKYLVSNIKSLGKLNLSLNRLEAQDADIPSAIMQLLGSQGLLPYKPCSTHTPLVLN
ncbi:hypothetical protein clem_12370 [Legionella clemsonensis]|uniref:Leucine Rich repeats (2 copies) n=1 Tax=Legionella clemsonensis TaxID=1867846 RepID=A0A222P584_9GAMM|nr:hypothetical protein clem_12370 [Legionella clemsonensis]